VIKKPKAQMLAKISGVGLGMRHGIGMGVGFPGLAFAEKTGKSRGGELRSVSELDTLMATHTTQCPSQLIFSTTSPFRDHARTGVRGLGGESSKYAEPSKILTPSIEPSRWSPKSSV
jgi:hypothetical protein